MESVVTTWHYVATKPSILPRTFHYQPDYYIKCGNSGNKEKKMT